MTPELVAAIIACLGAIAAWFRARADVNTIRDERATTKSERDKEAQELHDDILKLKFDVTNIKGTVNLHDTLLSDISKQMNILSTNIAILSEKIDSLNNIINEVKSK